MFGDRGGLRRAKVKSECRGAANQERVQRLKPNFRTMHLSQGWKRCSNKSYAASRLISRASRSLRIWKLSCDLRMALLRRSGLVAGALG